jgi:hypothetical protein
MKRGPNAAKKAHSSLPRCLGKSMLFLHDLVNPYEVNQFELVY